MRKRLILLLFVLAYNSGYGLKIKQVYYYDNATSSNLSVIDSDHNGYYEIYFALSHVTNPWPWSLFANTGGNDYSYLTINPPCSSYSWCAGYIDDDSLADMVAWKTGQVLSVWESPTYNSYITSLVWSDTVDIANAWDTYITDLDQDGKKEILCKARKDYTIRIYECAGDNNYQLVYKHSVWDAGLTMGYTGGIAYGDWDQDGKMEFCHADDGGFDQIAEVFTYECVGDDSFEVVAIDSVYTKNAYEAAQADDMDGDGKPEFIIGGRHNDGTNLWDDVINIFEATGPNAYASSWNVTLQTVVSVDYGGAWDIKTGDVDGDSISEVVIATSESLIVYKAFGNNNYQRIYRGLTGPGPYNCRLYDAVLLCYDLNQNGYDEIVVSGYYYNLPVYSTQYYETRIYEVAGEINWDSLKATAQDSCIQVNWATSRQFANYGFNVWRATAAAGPYSIVHSTYDTVRLDTTSLLYYFNDSAVTSGIKYFYKVQAKALNDTSIFIGPDSATGVTGKPEDRIPNIEFRMVQNRPNPFSSQTAIKYQIPKSGVVSLKVYNIQGQLVRILDNGYRIPGYYEAKWDGRDEQGQAAGNGVYFCKLNCNGQSQSKKIILMR